MNTNCSRKILYFSCILSFWWFTCLGILCADVSKHSFPSS